MGLDDNADDRTHTERDKGRSGNLQTETIESVTNSEGSSFPKGSLPNLRLTLTLNLTQFKLQHNRAIIPFSGMLFVYLCGSIKLFTIGLFAFALFSKVSLCIAARKHLKSPLSSSLLWSLYHTSLQMNVCLSQGSQALEAPGSPNPNQPINI